MSKFKELSDWIMLEHCATRIKVGGDVNDISDRVAFIEKTPRVRVSKYYYGVESKNDNGVIGQKNDAWIFGPKGSSDYGIDLESREWCDNMLKLLGWE